MARSWLSRAVNRSWALSRKNFSGRVVLVTCPVSVSWLSLVSFSSTLRNWVAHAFFSSALVSRPPASRRTRRSRKTCGFLRPALFRFRIPAAENCGKRFSDSGFLREAFYRFRVYAGSVFPFSGNVLFRIWKTPFSTSRFLCFPAALRSSIEFPGEGVGEWPGLGRAPAGDAEVRREQCCELRFPA